MYEPTHKDKMIGDLVLTDYHDLSNLNEFKNEEEVHKLSRQIVNLINENQNITAGDKIKAVKRILLMASTEAAEMFLKYKEDKEREKMEHDMK